MKMLHIRHDGREVLTASWTASAKDAGRNVELSYTWRGCTEPAFGAERVTLEISFAEFLKPVASPEPIIDLRDESNA